MRFKSRLQFGYYQLLLALFLPRKGILRPWKAILIDILRQKESTHAISAGVAAGVFGALFPIYGLQMLISAITAKILKGNLWVALLASWIGNPLTYPFFWWLEWRVGSYILLGDWPKNLIPNFFEVLVYTNLSSVWFIIKPMLFGFPIVSTAFAFAFYFATYTGLVKFKCKYPRYTYK